MASSNDGDRSMTMIINEESLSSDDQDVETYQANRSSLARSSAGSTSSTATNNTSSTGKRQKEMPPCFVCGAKANGYNFDQITCESCKAFFRRNALKSMDKFRCRNNNHCPITVATRKRCKRCRLSKCFQVGMRKEWILTEEEKTIKRQKIAHNRMLKMRAQHDVSEKTTNTEMNTQHSTDQTTSHLHQSTIIPLPSLQMFSPGDQKLFERHYQILAQLSNGYQAINRQYPQPKTFAHQKAIIAETVEIESKVLLIKELTRELTEMTTARLLNFFSLIPEFQALNQHEKKSVLIQNMLTVFMFHGALTYNAENDTFVDRATNDRPYDAKYLHFVYGPQVYNTFISLARRMTDVTYQKAQEKQPDEHEHTLFLLLMVILLFSSDFHCHSIERTQIEQLRLREKLSKIQNHYVEIACRFIQDRLGLVMGRRVFHKLVPLLRELQKLCSTLANVNLCEMAEDVGRSNANTSIQDGRLSNENRFHRMNPSTSITYSSTEFNPTMISGTAHLNELQKENRAPAFQPTRIAPAPLNQRASPTILSNMSRTPQTSSAPTVSQQFYAY